MNLDEDQCYRALVSRDKRFDGLFFVAAKTTGIYCRTVCPARTPARERCTFYRTAAQAERDGFRACFRCRPELAPGKAPIDSTSRLVKAATARIDAGALNEITLDELAHSLGVTARHLRRAMQTELGVSPMQLALTGRFSLAKRLLHDTALPITEVAFASGFQSLRRFNAAFLNQFGRNPSQVRRTRKATDPGAIVLDLHYRPPLDWEAMLSFIASRAAGGSELVRDGVYWRTVHLDPHRGWIAVSHSKDRNSLRVEVSPSLARALMRLVARIRRLFDLDAQPHAIASHLRRDSRLANAVSRRQGLRVPGAFEPFDTAVRAILGQQISVSAATTLYGRLISALGSRIETMHAELTHVSPTPARILATSEDELVSLGVLRSRAATIRRLAEAIHSGKIVLEQESDAETAVHQLEQLPGIGRWTAHYIAMRALGWPDAFPEGDLGIRKALGGISASQARAVAEPWRPWRAYAVMHLWTSLEEGNR